jgi:hypothetical protein
MSKLDLRVRNLENGEMFLATFENEVEACKWLMNRPRWMEVYGVATHGLAKEVYTLLRTAAKPLDEEEQGLAARLDAEAEAVAQKEEEESRRRDAEEIEAYKEAQRKADPNRPMLVRWQISDGFSHENPYDPREITAEAREAILAWVRERDGWVKDRGLVVGEAIVTVWPTTVPEGDGRVHPGGQFFPTLPLADGDAPTT